MRISDWSSDVCSSDLHRGRLGAVALETFLHRQADFAERRARARGLDRVCEQIGFDRLRRGGRLAQRVERALTRGFVAARLVLVDPQDLRLAALRSITLQRLVRKSVV